MMYKKIIIQRSVITALSTFIINAMGLLFHSLVLLVLLMLIDYLSGLLAAKKEKMEYPDNKSYGWSSRKGIIGIYKKVGYILTILVAIISDYLLFKYTKETGIDYQSNSMFGLLVTIWFIVNELISILENANRMGVYVPKFLLKSLSSLQNEINDNSNQNNRK